MSGKEAAVYVVRCGDELRCAKVYKEANKRSFRQAVKYQEGRKVRSSRDARAMAKGSKHGRKEKEENWQNAEVAVLFRLADAGAGAQALRLSRWCPADGNDRRRWRCRTAPQ